MIGSTDMATVEPAHADDSGRGWFVYGVVEAGVAVPEGLMGLDQEPVVTQARGRVAALVSPVVIDRPPGRGADLLAYNGVLDAVTQRGVAVVPVRFGSVLPDEQSIVEEFLGPDESYFAELLASLGGRAQFVIHGLYDEQAVLSEIVAGDPEIAELRAQTRDVPEEESFGARVRLGELVAGAVEARREVDTTGVLDQVLPLAEAYVERPVSGVERVFDVALLVADTRRDELDVRLERLAEEVHPRMRLRLLGPTAPFDFSGGG